jgi:NAD(P)-dependent dehydrogenase (short-subunit alcohol dehydrogenase family)
VSTDTTGQSQAGAQRRFHGKVCIVSGGGSGIGQATCRRLAGEGGRVVVADLNEDHGNETVRLIAAAGGQAIFAKCDVSKSADVQGAVQAALDKWDRVDVVVNDAAMMTFTKIVDLDEQDWDRVLAVNLKSVFLFCKYAVPHMKPGGAVVNVSSVHAHETEHLVVPYATSKGGMEAFTRGFALECEEAKVRVNCVAPGAVDTPMLWSNPLVKSGQEKVTGAVGKPEDIAAVIAFLASGEGRFINGTTVVADGARLDIL